MSSIRIPKTATAAEILKCLDEWGDVEHSFDASSPVYPLVEERRKLWDVLTALRGPDKEVDSIEQRRFKTDYTEPIRAVVSRLASVCGAFTHKVLNLADLCRIANTDLHGYPPSKEHFVRHSKQAAKCLRDMIRREELEDGPES